MNSRITKITHEVKLLLSDPLVVNAYVQISGNEVRQVNWGDDINYHFLKHITERKILIYSHSAVAMKLRLPNYLCIGSTLNYLPTRKTIVWGAGIIDPTLGMRERPAFIHAVRGPLSRDYLLSTNVSCPEIYGDPALLIPYFYKPTRLDGQVKGKICVVPHYADRGSPIIGAIRKKYPNLPVLDIVNYNEWTDFIDQICKYDAVLSSSLHGLVIAEAFGIPNYWVNLSGGVDAESDANIGKGFKFRDHFASLGKQVAEPFVLDQYFDPNTFLADHPWDPGRIDLKKLLAACPFEIKKSVQYEHPLDLR